MTRFQDIQNMGITEMAEMIVAFKNDKLKLGVCGTQLCPYFATKECDDSNFNCPLSDVDEVKIWLNMQVKDKNREANETYEPLYSGYETWGQLYHVYECRECGSHMKRYRKIKEPICYLCRSNAVKMRKEEKEMNKNKVLRLNEERTFKEGFMLGVKLALRTQGMDIEEDAAELLFKAAKEGIEAIDEG